MPNYLILPNEGKPDLLAYMIKQTISGVNPWSLRLFQNDLTPDANSVEASFEEADWDGYAAVTMERALWTEPTIDNDTAKSTWKTTPTVWTNEDEEEVTVYGCYYTDDDAGVVRGAFRFDTPAVIPVGLQLSVLPAFWLCQCEDS